MKINELLNNDFIILTHELKTRVLISQWNALCQLLVDAESTSNFKQLVPELSSILNADSLYLFETILDSMDEQFSWKEIGLMLLSIGLSCNSCNAIQPSEIIWTGPVFKDFKVRRIEQVLYDLINQAESSIMLVTFAASKVKALHQALADAILRGVEVTMIIEFEDESAGQLSFDSIKAFPATLISNMNIFYWPIEKRECNSKGKPGKLHAKCAVIDDYAIVTSANLTDDAFNRNMELGILFKGGTLPSLINNHFNELIFNEILIKYS